MTWLIRFKDGRYEGVGFDARDIDAAAKFRFYEDACRCITQWEQSYITRRRPRIVRLKPRAKLDEAQIRRDERLRIAGAFGERGILVLFNNSAVAEASGLSRTEIGAKVIQRAILAYEWKP